MGLTTGSPQQVWAALLTRAAEDQALNFTDTSGCAGSALYY